MRRLEVLFLPHPVAAVAAPWATDVIEAVSARHNLRIFDRTQPAAPQLFLGGPADLDRVVAESDYLSLHLHLTPETRHTIDERRIGLMKETACLINVARGALVDEEALYEALLKGRLGGAGLDVFAQEPPDATAPVFQLPNVFAMPHTAGSTDGTSRKRAHLAADNLDRYVRGEALVGQITSRFI